MDELWGLFLRSILVYFFIFLMMRLMGKREVGKLSIFDLVVSFMVADISAISLESMDKPLIKGLLPIFTIVVLQILLSYVSLKSEPIRHLIDGTPSVIVNQGKIDQKEMVKARYNLDDLLMQLREKDIADIRDVEYAILETSGKLSVFLKTENLPLSKGDVHDKQQHQPFRLPTPLVIEGKIQQQELAKLGRDANWLKQQLRQLDYVDERDIFYASLDQEGDWYIADRRG